MTYLYFVAAALFVLSAHPAKAVPPPDFIFNVTSQIAQFFSISVILFSAAGSVVYRFFQQRFAGKRKLVFWIIAGLGAITLSGGGAWLYGRYVQQQEMKLWLAQSSMATTDPDQINIDQEPTSTRTSVPTDELDQLTLGDQKPAQKAVAQPEDAVSKFIQRYYASIAAHQFSDAYEMSKKSVSLETFKEWYASTTDISIDRLQRIDDKTSSLELTLTEDGKTTRYGVLMVIKRAEDGQPTRVESSLVRVLSESSSVATSSTTPILLQASTTDYFTAQTKLPEAISNADFQTALNQTSPFLILDAREDVEFENGHFPDATHIRFADLKAGRWIELPTDRPVYVFCWSGIRGKEVAEFLRTKKIAARYLEKGANGWVADQGTWSGEIAFLKVYTDDRYKRVFTPNAFQDSVNKGTIMVDSRPPASFNAWHIPGSINIPLMYTPSIGIEKAFAQVPPNSQVITVCDEYVNCFDAKLTGVELERRGHAFLGRFAEPWKLKSQ
ncbi:MAG: rhodanese-like domain-containing protein [Candidatus Uhrbacteria bacterium]|nr:rhodanese-like domain-containing protein [Candidatus Uhrbacteria bacterium]